MKTKVLQSNFLSGVLSPEAKARVETDSYNNGLLTGINIVPRPLGGVQRRPGLRMVDTLPYQLTRRTGMTITATNGGTTANANDDDPTTLLSTSNNVGTTNPYVVVHYDLGSALAVTFADVRGIRSTGGSSTQFCIQYSADNSNWTTLGDAFELVDTTVRSYRRESAVSARYWRVARIGSADMGSVTIALQEFNLWVATTTVSNVRLFAFEVSTDLRYLVAVTARSMSIYQNDALLVSLPAPYDNDDIPDLDAAQSQDSMVFVHKDHPPFFLFPEFDTFYFDEIQFTSIPQYDYNDDDSPTPTSDVQVLTFASGWAQGETFQIDLEGARTAAITYGGDATSDEQSTTADNIAREVQKLYTVPGFTGVSCARTGTRQYTITFAGASAKDYELLIGVPLTSDSAITVSKSANGVPRTEDAWSATRGYPHSVTFFEGRMYFGGTRSLPQSILASRVNQILEFEIDEARDDDAIFTTLNSQKLNAIEGMFSGRTLQLMTSGGEFRYVKQAGTPITPGDAPTNQTNYGSAHIRPVDVDGATIFIQRTRKAVRDFRYDYEEDAYNSLGVSALAPHLINDVVDLTAWNGSRTDEINLAFVVNGDGTLAVLNFRRETDTRAWTQWVTAGSFRAVASLIEERYFAVERTINGTDVLFLEVADESCYSDCSVLDALVAESTISGLDHLNGAECRVHVGYAVLANQTPAAGSITLTEGAFTGLAEVGLNFDPTLTPMPLNQMLPTGASFMGKQRIIKIKAKVLDTLGLRVNGRPLADTFYDQHNWDEPSTPFSGVLSIEESLNHDEGQDQLVIFTQVDPLPMTILAIEVPMEGTT